MSDINSLRRVGARVVHKESGRRGVVEAVGDAAQGYADFVRVRWADSGWPEWVLLEALTLDAAFAPYDIVLHATKSGRKRVGVVQEVQVAAASYPFSPEHVAHVRWLDGTTQWVLARELRLAREGDIAGDINDSQSPDLQQLADRVAQLSSRVELLSRQVHPRGGVRLRPSALTNRLRAALSLPSLPPGAPAHLIESELDEVVGSIETTIKDIRLIASHHAVPGRSLPDQVRELLKAENDLTLGRVNITNRLRVALGQEKLDAYAQPDVRQALGNVLEDVEVALRRGGIAAANASEMSKLIEVTREKLRAACYLSPTASLPQVADWAVNLIADKQASGSVEPGTMEKTENVAHLTALREALWLAPETHTETVLKAAVGRIKGLPRSGAEDEQAAEALEQLAEALGMENASMLEVFAAANDVVRRPAQLPVDVELADAAQQLREVLQPAEEASLALVIGAAVEEIQNLRTDKRVFKKQLEAFDGCVPLMGGLRERISGLGNGPAPYARVLEEVTRRVDECAKLQRDEELRELRARARADQTKLDGDGPQAPREAPDGRHRAAFVELLHKPYDSGGAAGRGWALMGLLRDAGHLARGFMAAGSMPLFRAAGMDPYRMKGLVGLEGAAMLLNAFAWDAGLIGTLRVMFPEPVVAEPPRPVQAAPLPVPCCYGMMREGNQHSDDCTRPLAKGDKVRLKNPKVTGNLHHPAHLVGTIDKIGEATRENAAWATVTWSDGVTNMFPIDLLERATDEKKA